MTIFEVDESTLVNLDRLGAVRFQDVGETRNVVIIVDGIPYIVPPDKHKKLFTALFKAGGELTKQYVAV